MLSRSAKLKLGITYWASATAVFGIVGWTTFTVVGLRNDLDQAEKDRTALSQQVKDLGGTPVAGPRGVAGQRGSDGRDGRDGDPGTAGENGTDGTDGSNGEAGRNGTDGKDGVDGIDGRDGAPGADGKDGADGSTGPQGEQGPPGPSCPDGYELRDAKYNFTPILVCMKIKE